MSFVHGPASDLRIKLQDFEILVLQIEYEVGTPEHNTLVEYCYTSYVPKSSNIYMLEAYTR